MIPIAKPLLGLEEAIAASRVVMSGWVSQGPQVAAFESEFAAFTGADHACAVSNCTTALHLALLAVGVGPGDDRAGRFQHRPDPRSRSAEQPDNGHPLRSPDGDALQCPRDP